MAIEVFKTNVRRGDHAEMLLDQIHSAFADYHANFDLEDCDRILRVASRSGQVQTSDLVILLNRFGFEAQVLPDDIPELLQF